ncbi:cryptochrome/photolyase family protein [Desulfosediminicola sp.]|uniref:cryptochrome/photolyase family protein n=1 Tax=Desulfosediminicola sp. TaxID=2886825 RepID=UPI003AF29E02
MKTLRLILGDQLNINHSWFNTTDDEILYCLFEMRQETDYVTHHVQKIIFFFAAMRSFAETLRGRGHQVIYLKLNANKNKQDLTENISLLISTHKIEKFEYLMPDEYRLDLQLIKITKSLNIPAEMFDTEHFLTQRDELAAFFGEKNYLMESYYRDIRKRFDILMDPENTGKPLTGKWNYDVANRKKLPADLQIPAPLLFSRDVSDLVKLLDKAGIKTIGEVDQKNFIWPVTRDECLELLEYFTAELLPHFGDYQDAMSEEYWSLYHSRISAAMNSKLLSPLEVVERAIKEWSKRQDEIVIAQIEGFVRQIIGWREYMRGVYWAHMPEFTDLNYFEADRQLPSWYWTGKTDMNCLHHAISQSLQYAYAHHIQRLMITGNFALLAGIAPEEIDAWYLGIYIDAIQWVEITNTRGMSQFADGGIVGTKPYCSSANYINKMSSYCTNCRYRHQERHGTKACPFNSLYWHFHHRHRELLENNPRIGMVYRTWSRKNKDEQKAILRQAEQYLEGIDKL